MDPTPENLKAIGQLISDITAGIGGLCASLVASLTAYQTFLKVRDEIEKLNKRRKRRKAANRRTYKTRFSKPGE